VDTQPTTPSRALGTLRGRVFAAVLFDLDGTLVDSTPAVERSWRTLAAEHGAELEFGTFHGIPAAQAVPIVLGDGVDLAAAVARLTELEVADTDGVRVLPGAAEALADLPRERAAIVTSCSADLADVRIAAAGLKPPDVVVTADLTPIGKPDPAPYLLAARLLEVDPADCLVIEDAPAGLTSARAAGAATLALGTTYDLAGLEADGHVPTLAAVRFYAAPGGVSVSYVGSE
jgi:mannitol-1-/sugar-/sorbitol-6-phosphatase